MLSGYVSMQIWESKKRLSDAISKNGLETMEHSTVQSAGWCRAATLSERRESLHTNRNGRSTFNPNLADRRMRRWRAQAPFSLGNHFAQRLTNDGFNEEDFYHCL